MSSRRSRGFVRSRSPRADPEAALAEERARLPGDLERDDRLPGRAAAVLILSECDGEPGEDAEVGVKRDLLKSTNTEEGREPTARLGASAFR